MSKRKKTKNNKNSFEQTTCTIKPALTHDTVTSFVKLNWPIKQVDYFFFNWKLSPYYIDIGLCGNKSLIPVSTI